MEQVINLWSLVIDIGMLEHTLFFVIVSPWIMNANTLIRCPIRISVLLTCTSIPKVDHEKETYFTVGKFIRPGCS